MVAFILESIGQLCAWTSRSPLHLNLSVAFVLESIDPLVSFTHESASISLEGGPFGSWCLNTLHWWIVSVYSVLPTEQLNQEADWLRIMSIHNTKPYNINYVQFVYPIQIPFVFLVWSEVRLSQASICNKIWSYKIVIKYSNKSILYSCMSVHNMWLCMYVMYMYLLKLCMSNLHVIVSFNVHTSTEMHTIWLSLK